MSNWSRCFRIGLGYRYAPESFYISLMQSDGSYKKLDVDTSGYMWGYWLSIGQEEKAVAEIKHFLRSRAKMQRRLVTYGYYLKDSFTQYVYNANSLFFANEYNIAEKLALYKANKKHWIDCGCKHHTSTTAALNGKYDVETVKKEYDEVDLSRPIRIYVTLK